MGPVVIHELALVIDSFEQFDATVFEFDKYRGNIAVCPVHRRFTERLTECTERRGVFQNFSTVLNSIDCVVFKRLRNEVIEQRFLVAGRIPKDATDPLDERGIDPTAGDVDCDFGIGHVDTSPEEIAGTDDDAALALIELFDRLYPVVARVSERREVISVDVVLIGQDLREFRGCIVRPDENDRFLGRCMLGDERGDCIEIRHRVPAERLPGEKRRRECVERRGFRT